MIWAEAELSPLLLSGCPWLPAERWCPYLSQWVCICWARMRTLGHQRVGTSPHATCGVGLGQHSDGLGWNQTGLVADHPVWSGTGLLPGGRLPLRAVTRPISRGFPVENETVASMSLLPGTRGDRCHFVSLREYVPELCPDAGMLRRPAESEHHQK